jgi:hypothetical protein
MVKINFGLIITGAILGVAAGTALHFLNPGNKYNLPSALAFHGHGHHGGHHHGGCKCGGGGAGGGECKCGGHGHGGHEE